MIGGLGRFLGRHHCAAEYEGQPMFASDMCEYATTIVADYTAITGSAQSQLHSLF